MSKVEEKTRGGKKSLQRNLWKMILTIALPLMLVIMAIATLGLWYAWQYNTILGNITTASYFNQDFKDDIDSKMYHYVINRQYSLGLPIEEVKKAEDIASELIAITTEQKSMRAISSVLNLSYNLEDQIYQVANAEGYSDRQEMLENRIYYLTDLIEEYMYTYLYYEAVPGYPSIRHDLRHNLSDVDRPDHVTASAVHSPSQLKKSQPKAYRSCGQFMLASGGDRPRRTYRPRSNTGRCQGSAVGFRWHRTDGGPPEAPDGGKHHAGEAATPSRVGPAAGAD
jgi:hypothetical protein